MSNFTFLQTEWPTIHQTACRVESYLQSDPRSACFYARLSLELSVQWLFNHDPAFSIPYNTNLAALLHDPSFSQNVPHHIYTKAQLIRKEGNLAAHSRTAISQQTALGVAIELHHLLYWLARTYTRHNPENIASTFNIALLPPQASPQNLKQLKQFAAALIEKDKQVKQQAQQLANYKQQLAALKAQIAAQKITNQHIPDTHDYTETQTRHRIIDVMLREAGWNPTAPNVAEYKVNGMPLGSGIGYADYVLWADNNLPLAVVEAKKTSVDPYRGKQQAKLYADCLEQMHGQRPLIFYSNGYNTYLWDDKNYPPRTVQGFYTKNQLMRLIQRRSSAKALAQVPIKQKIVNRYYQQAAIREITAHFSAKQRKGLLVMATGAGKTRVAIALVDLLMRANWVKRILFLADRSALVKQATGAFKTFMPASNPVNLLQSGSKTVADSARVVVSTYHTMLNLIDKNQDDGQKLFSVGHFDLVIIDEAHRSIYKKFGAIFAYFDSLLLGLTATPKDEIDRNTYRLFDLEDGVPTFSYSLEQAIADNYLVPYQAVETPTQFITQGIKYADLSDAEKAEWDHLEWGNSEDMPDSIAASAINQWLFNQDTVDLILKTVMKHGLKVDGGDRLGKTIIFAKNHNHAKFIETRFNHHYPTEAGHFAQVIDTTINYAQSLITHFSNPNKNPHIAISVDMLDTGIDVPEVVNLVFFKVVRSQTKFFQMIGRGTRLRPNLFGPGLSKTHFLIFDVCMNFEYFSQNPTQATTTQPQPLSQSLFKKRLSLLNKTRQLAQTNPALKPLATTLADSLHAYVAAMNTDNFIVRPHREYVDPFKNRKRWHTLSPRDIVHLEKHVSALPSTHPQDNELIKRFDLMLLTLQLSYLEATPNFNRLRDKVIDLAIHLESKTSIPSVKAQLPFIKQVQTEAFWAQLNLLRIEEIRQRLRNLATFADKEKRKPMYTAFKDSPQAIKEISNVPYTTGGVNIAQYKKKVEQFIRDHQDYSVIQKIRWAIPLNSDDLAALERFFYQADAVGGHAQFVKAYGQQENLATFIRSLVGLDRAKAKEHFAQFLDGKTYTANQIRFVNYIINHLTANGTIAPELLYSQPYTDINHQGLSGVFSKTQAKALLQVVQAINVVITK